MQLTDFSDASPGRLVPAHDGAFAFLPDPLPRYLDLDLTTVQLLTEADHLLGRLGGATRRLVNPYLIGSPLLRREAILSSRIEGTVTTAEQLVLFEAGGEARTPDTREVLNYFRAMNHGLALLPRLPVSLRLIRETHQVLMSDVRGHNERPGHFRDSQNWIGRPGQSIHEARFVPPPPQDMLPLLTDLEVFLNEEKPLLPLLIRVALAHYQFEAIHPFRDGNGRIGRLLIPLILCRDDRLPAPLLYLSAYFERNRDEYMDRLLRVSQSGEYIEWVRFFLRGVAECAAEAGEQVEGLMSLRLRWHGRFHSARSSALLLKLIDHLFVGPSTTIAGAAKFLGVTPASSAANIRKLQEAGFLTEVTGRKRDQVFVAREIVAFIQDGGPTLAPNAGSSTETRQGT